MQATHEQRRTTPSYTIPFLFAFLEIVIMWIAVAIIEGSINIMTWNLLSYIILSIWFLYTLYKLKRVLTRQIIHKD